MTLRYVILCMVSALLASVATLCIQTYFQNHGILESQSNAVTLSSAIDDFRCKRGLNKLVIKGGVDDNFSSQGNEPSRIRPALLPNPYLEALRDAQSGMMLLRDYDELGSDKMWIDYFDVPRNIVSGQIILRIKGEGTQQFDGLWFGELDQRKMRGHYDFRPAFSYQIGSDDPKALRIDTTTGVRVLDLNTKAFRNDPSQNESMINYLNRSDRPDQLDMRILDDTIVDAVAIVVCQEPLVAKGTSFVEHHEKVMGPDVSHFSCSADQTQTPCDPFQGDQICSVALPVACFKRGGVAPKSEASRGFNFGVAAEIRLTPAVAGNDFEKIDDVNAFCNASFGTGWQVMAFHDAPMGVIATYSKIPPKTRAWIDVRDQRYANCWDRNRDRNQ